MDSLIDGVKYLIDFILHIEVHLQELFTHYGNGIYAILFAIVFCETGLVIMPFLPGDSLLFALGAFSSDGTLSVTFLWILLFTAAVLGDALNYTLGRNYGTKIIERFEGKVIKRVHLQQAEIFFEKWGGWAVVLARFAPFLRTFVPFIAGISRMNYPRFFVYNVLGGFVWITSFLFAGYFFGKLPFFQNNMKLLILGIIIVSLIPAVIGFFKARSIKIQNSK
jgi:membrane-associated protein